MLLLLYGQWDKWLIFICNHKLKIVLNIDEYEPLSLECCSVPILVLRVCVCCKPQRIMGLFLLAAIFE